MTKCQYCYNSFKNVKSHQKLSAYCIRIQKSKNSAKKKEVKIIKSKIDYKQLLISQEKRISNLGKIIDEQQKHIEKLELINQKYKKQLINTFAFILDKTVKKSI